MLKKIFESILNESEFQKLVNLKQKLAFAAQRPYDNWDQDDEGYSENYDHSGGICQDVAEAMSQVLSDDRIENTTISQQSGEQHVYVIAKMEDGVYIVDINPFSYETGGGYNWKKIPGVIFDESYIDIRMLSGDPDDFESYFEN